MKKLLLFTICGLLACADMLRAEVEFPFSRDEYFELESREVRNINYVLTSVTATKDDELSEEWGLYVWHLAFENADGIKGGAMLTLKNAENAIPAGTYTIEMFGDAEASDGIDEDGNPTGCYIYDPALGESTPYLFVTSGSLTIGYIEQQLTVALNGKTYFGSTVTFKYPTADVFDPAAAEISNDEAYNQEPTARSNFNVKVASIEHNYDGSTYSLYQVDDYIISMQGENGERLMFEIWLDHGLASQGHLPEGNFPILDVSKANGLNWFVWASTGYSIDGYAYSLATIPNGENVDIYFITGGSFSVNYDANGRLTLTGTVTTAHGSVISFAYSEATNTGLTTVDATELGAFAADGRLHFNAQGGQLFRIFDTTGRCITSGKANEGINSIELPTGAVILNVERKSAKIIVK